MRKRKNFFISFLVLFFAAFVLFILWRLPLVAGINTFIGRFFAPLGSSINKNLTHKPSKNGLESLQTQNRQLLEKLAKFELLSKENKALSDQFQTVYPKASVLMPANIVGKPSFVPGETLPLEFILDKGRGDGVKKGQAVVVEDNLVGEIKEVTNGFSVVTLITNSKFSLTAKSARQQALGVVRGQDSSNILFGNILPAFDIKPSDIVVTAGSLDKNGFGIPANLVIGKIVSVNKNPSAIFQTCDVKSLIDFSNLSLVFVYK